MSKPAIISISSHVVRGTVGNRAAVFALETLGFPVWSVPTVTLSWHPGHGPATRIVPPLDAFAAMLSDLKRAPWLGEVGGILTGYLGHADQAGPIASLIRAVKAQNPRALYVCDPVIGDGGGLYVPQPTAQAIRDTLLPLADLATPNRTELDWLTGNSHTTLDALIAAARGAAPKAMLVTSAPAGDGRIGNLYIDVDQALLAAHDIVAPAPNGLGDLTAALMLAHRLDGLSAPAALTRATASVFDCLNSAVAHGADELTLETDAASLREPTSTIHIKHISENADLSLPTLVGVDGCRKGWIAVSRNADGELDRRVHETFAALVAHYPKDAIIAVDMPIGLADMVGRGGREPEQLIRKLLKGGASSVFSTPSRSAVYAAPSKYVSPEDDKAGYERVKKIARETSSPSWAPSIFAFAIMPKIQAVDAVLRSRPASERRILESHPEAAFYELNDRQELLATKKTLEGIAARRSILVRNGFDHSFVCARPPSGSKHDDFLDACAMLLVAKRYVTGQAISYPNEPLNDAHGISDRDLDVKHIILNPCLSG